MVKNLTITLLVFVMMLVIASLSGCGSATPTAAQDFGTVLTTGNNTGGTNNTTAVFGLITLSGTNLIGTSFAPASTSIAPIPLTGQTYYYWFSANSSQIFPQNRLTLLNDTAAGGIVAVGISYYATTSSIGGPAWGLASTTLAPISAASITFSPASRSVTFNNLTLPALASTTIPLTLNGTLKY